MDDATFLQFLRDQRAALAQIDSAVRSNETNIVAIPDDAVQTTASPAPVPLDKALQTRLMDVARRLGDAYMICDDEQRDAIRRVIERSPTALAHMAIAPGQIRHRIDETLFRLALIYESMKDLLPSARDGLDRLDTLCEAARTARFDPNPFLHEVADVSCRVKHSSLGSMRSALLKRIVIDDGWIRCERCKNRYSKELPECPSCAERNPDLAFNMSAEMSGEQGPFYVEEEVELIYVPTLKALPYMIYSAGSSIGVLALLLFYLSCCFSPAVVISWLGWVIIGFWIALTVLQLFLRRGPLAKYYFTSKGEIKIGYTRFQNFLMILIHLAFLAAAATLVAVWSVTRGDP